MAGRCRPGWLAVIGSLVLTSGLGLSGWTANAAAPLRIVSLAPSITETLFALEAGDEVVGVSQYCDYPRQVEKLPKIGSFLTPNVEAIVALHPSLIIGLESSANQRELKALKALGYPLLLVGNDSLDDIRRSILGIGEKIGRAEPARALLAEVDYHSDEVRRRLDGAPLRKVLMLVGHRPMVAVGSGTFLNELITLARGANIAASLGREWPRVSVEFVIAMAPDVIIDGQMGTDSASPDRFWDRYQSIPAVKEHRVYGFDQDPMLRPGPRVWQSLEILASLIHPEVFRPFKAGTETGSSGAH